MKKVISTVLISTFAFVAISNASIDINASSETNFKSFFNIFKKKNQENKEEKSDRKDNSSATTTASTTLTTTQKTCVQNAIAAHEDATIASLDGLYASVRNALVVRKAALSAAVNAEASATSTNVSAYAAYKTSLKTSLDKIKTDNKLAKSNYQIAIKNCGLENNSNASIKLKTHSFFGFSI